MPEVFMGQRLTHLMPVEIELWKRFLVKYNEEFERFEYDVHLGEGIPVDPRHTPEIQRAATILTQKRLDVVGFKTGEVWLFEVKPDAGLSAVGQLVSYNALWIRERGPDPAPILSVVTDRINRDEQYLFDQFKIRTYIVTP